MRKTTFSMLTAAVLLAFVFAALHPVSVQAARYSNDTTGYALIIEDDANLLTEEEETLLLEDMKDISNYGNVAFKSTDSNSSTARQYAENYYYSEFGNNSGMVFLIDMDNRQIYIACSGAIYKAVTTSKANTITDNVYRYASRGDYYGCASNAFAQALKLLQGQAIAEPMKHISNAILSLILAMLIFFVVITASSRAKRAGSEIMITGAKKTSLESTEPNPKFVRETRRYSPVQRSGGGGGGSSGGGGGGGGFSGGGGGHGF